MSRMCIVAAFFLPVFAFGQLTNREVYDYEPGDVIERGTFVNYPTIVIDTILTRYDSPTNDSIIYTISQTVFQPWSPMNPGYEYHLIDTLIIHNLDSLSSHFSEFSCLEPVLLSGVDTVCGRIYSALHSSGSNLCFEAPTWNSVLYKGLGGPYYTVFYPEANQNVEFKLIYYNTAQNGSCGNYFASTIGLKENVIGSIQTIPNPCTDELSIQGVMPNTVFTILDMNNRIVYNGIHSGAENSISTAEWPAGVYFLRTESGEFMRFHKL